MGTITDSQTYTRKLFTILALTALLGAQLVTMGVGQASAASLGDPGTAGGFITFSDGEDHDQVEFFFEQQGADVDLSSYGYIWDASNDGLFHLSCSQTLINTTATTTGDSSVFDAGETVEIVDFNTTRVNRGGKVQQCVPEDFIDPDPGLEVSKTVSEPTVDHEDPFTYTIEVTSVGTTTARDVVVTDELDLLDGSLEVVSIAPEAADADSAGCLIDNEDVVTCSYGDLSPGESRTITITVVSVSVDACGPVSNVASATANDGASDTSDPVDVTIECPDPVSGIALTKAADETSLVDPEVGDEVTYSFTITNTGEDALSGTELIDAIYDGLAELGDYDEDGFDLDVLDSFAIDDADGASLAIDEQLVLEDAYTHAITQDDIDRGGIYNVATVTATGDESDDEVSATDDELVTITLTPPTVTPNPDIAIEKSAVEGVDFDDDGNPFVVFDEDNGSHDITYEYEIANTGDEDLIDLSLVDDQIGDLSDEFQAAVGDGPFPAGESVTVTAVHGSVTADDFDEGLLVNVATVSGFGPESDQTVTDVDDETVFDVDVLGVIPAITVDKTAVDGVSLDSEGNWVVELSEGETATITYEFFVTNPSEDALSDLSLFDDKIGDLSAELEQAVIDVYGEPVLPSEGSVTVTADYETTAEDFANGSTTNVVDVEGIGELSGVTVTDSDDETVFITEVLAEVEVVEETEPEDDVEVAAEVETLPRTGLDGTNMLLLGVLFSLLGAVALMLSPGRREGPGPALSM